MTVSGENHLPVGERGERVLHAYGSASPPGGAVLSGTALAPHADPAGSPGADDEQLRSVIDTAHEAFVSMDSDGLITYWNPEAERTFGWPRAEAVGRSLVETIVPPQHRKAHRRGIQRFLESGEGPVLGKRLEIEALHRDGREFFVELTISAIRQEDGWNFNAFMHDISDRRSAEQELRLMRRLALAIGAAEQADEALAEAVRLICDATDLDAGQAWVLNADGSRLVSSPTWHARRAGIESFRAASEGISFEPGFAFVGRAWSTRSAQWVDDLGSDPECLRSSLARDLELGGALSVPVLAKHDVVAVLEFLVQDGRARDERLEGLVSTVAAQLGSLIQRKRAEASLREREVQLTRAQRVARLGSWEWEIEPDEVSWSEELYRLFGLDRSSFSASYGGFLELVQEADRERVDQTIRRALEDRSPFEHEYRVACPNEAVRVMHCHGEVVCDRTGAPVRMVGTCQDVTQQRRLEEESARFWNLSLDLLAILSFDGEIRQTNPAHMLVLGYTEEELCGRSYLELIHPNDRESVRAEAERLSGGERQIGDFEARVRARDGTYKTLLCSARSSPDSQLIYTVAKDVTERRRSEEQIALARELAVKIGEASNVQDAIELTLSTICERTGWALGQAWVPVAGATYLECSPAWFASSDCLQEFRARSESVAFGRGEGLPGSVWSARKSVWMADVRSDAGFLRAPVAREVGLGAGLGVPVLAGDEVVAVLEFFVLEPRSEDEQLVDLVSAAAAQLGSLVRRRETEDALRVSEERFRLLVDNVRDYAILVLDRNGHVESWNQGAERITGYLAEDIIGYHISRLYSSEAVEQAEPERQLEAAATSGRFEEADWRVRKDGLRFWANVVITPLRDKAGELRGFSYVTQDVSDRRRSEEDLQRLAAIVEHSDDAIFTATPGKGVVSSWNPGAERLFGYRAREIVGRSVSILVPPDQNGSAGILRDLLEGKRIEHHEMQVLRKNDGRVEVSLTVSPIRNGSGAAAGVSVIARDITERKRAQRQLESAFGTYLDRDIANHILKAGPLLEGDEVDVSTMFVDIRDFTAFAERYDPREVVATLNCLFELAVPIITERGGHVDKFVGDGLLAVFGAPERLEDHADLALEAALEIDRAAREQFQGELEIGIGLDSGTVIAGNVGGGGRLDFTVIGDAVNTAARIETATRHTGDTILFSDETKARLRSTRFPVIERPGVPVKGKTHPLRLYTPATPWRAESDAGTGLASGSA